MVRTKTLVIAATVAIALGLAAYTYYGEHESINRLEFEVIDARLPRIGAISADLELHVQVTNPTAHPTPFFSMEYDVFLGDGRVASVSVNDVKVLAQSSSVQTRIITINYTEVAGSVIDALTRVARGEEIEVTVRGTRHVRFLFGLVSASYPIHG